MFTQENFINGLCKNIRSLCVDVEDSILVISKIYNDYESSEDERIDLGCISKVELQTVIDELNANITFDRYMLYQEKNFEVPLRQVERYGGFSSRYLGEKQYEVSEHNYNFYISRATSKYIVALMCFSAANPEVDFGFGISFHGIFRENSVNSLDDLCSFLRILTAKVSSETECKIGEFRKYIQSYLFNISYNKNVVFSISDFCEFERPRRRAIRREGQLFPYKSYKTGLVKYYYQGTSTDIPFTQYLAFYHVAEYFFQSIAEQEAFSEIESFITRPSFSPHKKEDIRRFYNMIKKKMRDQRDDGVWDEKTGLLLCLKKYVPDIANLKLSIMSIDPTSIDYYKNNEVIFADEGNKINFDNISDGTYKEIRNRVYAVRNSIVHSKEGERLRYEPFKHDKELSKEIPLIRAIAEEIIINSAETMNINY